MSENQTPAAGGKSFVATILLCLFLGTLGVHRFYTGKTGTAVAMLLITLLLGWLGIGILVTGIWALVDLIQICIGNFKAADGSDLVR